MYFYINKNIIHDSIWEIEDNENFNIETNEAIKELVYKALNVQYRKKYKYDLDEIFTQEFQIEVKESWYNFYKLEFLIYIDKQFMQSLRVTGENELKVGAAVEGFPGDGIYYQIFTIIQNPDGT